MVYCETIESSRTWVCPKTGIWKVICIGGGGAGSAYTAGSGAQSAEGEAGGTTSFGTYLSASGGVSGKYFNDGKVELRIVADPSFGVNGYNGASVYGTQSPEYMGSGYGASGGAFGSGKIMNAGLPGDVATAIFDIDANTSVACTIGRGGTVTLSSESNKNALAWSGRDGAIIVQYLASDF